MSKPLDSLSLVYDFIPLNLNINEKQEINNFHNLNLQKN